MSRRSFWAGALVAATLLASGLGMSAEDQAPPASTSSRPVTVFVLRHAEKTSAPPEDPGLSPEGVRRAEALAALLGEAGVTHLVASEFRRTQETLRPLAARVGLELIVEKAGAIDELAGRVKALPPGSVAVIAGHSNTVPAIVRALGGTLRGNVTALDDADYGRLFLMIRPNEPGDSVQTLELRYGP